jgi:hypothetical protein
MPPAGFRQRGELLLLFPARLPVEHAQLKIVQALRLLIRAFPFSHPRS